MGSCSSVQKGRKSSMVASPVHKESEVQVVGSAFSLKNSEFGSKEDTFFDSQAWLDSDCEDDFFSVNGDFTPSRGSTPNHQTSAILKATFDKSFSFDKFPGYKSKPSPSPTGRKKLGDHFQETPQPNTSDTKYEAGGEHNFSHQIKSDQPLSGADSVKSTPSRDSKNKEARVRQCCLPSLSFSGRNQKTGPVKCSAY